jgi:hypothetical protein
MSKKAKDPAFLFYPDHFTSGTQFFTDEQTGKYIRLLCAQHQHGHLKEKHMMHICRTYDEDVFSKFVKDEAGLFYNERLELEMERRKKYSESRADNRSSTKNQTVKPNKKKNTSKTHEKHMPPHMVNVDVNVNKDIIIDKNKEGENEIFEIDPHPYLKKIKSDYPVLLKMKEPLTEAQAQRLEIDIGDDLVYEKLEAMANKANILKNYISANLTLRTWVNYSNKNGKSATKTSGEKIGRVPIEGAAEFLSRGRIAPID